MKRIIFVLALFTTLLSCKKETPSPTPTPETPKKDTVPTPLDSSKIVLTDGIASIGEPIGKHGEILTDIEGNTYRTVIIGNQQWMAENLKVSKYNEGTDIPQIKDYSIKYSTKVGGWSYYYNFDTVNSAYNEKYGKYYNWFVTNSVTNGNKNVCPTGWHIPTIFEWDTLSNYLGGVKVAGGKMKEIGTQNWYHTNNDATNTSLFNGLPARSIGISTLWWSSTNEGDLSPFAHAVGLTRFDGWLDHETPITTTLFSIRCLKNN